MNILILMYSALKVCSLNTVLIHRFKLVSFIVRSLIRLKRSNSLQIRYESVTFQLRQLEPHDSEQWNPPELFVMHWVCKEDQLHLFLGIFLVFLINEASTRILPFSHAKLIQFECLSHRSPATNCSHHLNLFKMYFFHLISQQQCTVFSNKSTGCADNFCSMAKSCSVSVSSAHPNRR